MIIYINYSWSNTIKTVRRCVVCNMTSIAYIIINKCYFNNKTDNGFIFYSVVINKYHYCCNIVYTIIIIIVYLFFLNTTTEALSSVLGM